MTTAYRVCHPYPGFDEFMMGMSKKKKEERHSFSTYGLFVYNSGGVKRNYNPPLLM